MKKILILLVFTCFSAFAHIDSMNQLFYGKRVIDSKKPCGKYGEVISIDDVKRIGVKNICYKVVEPWSIVKIKDVDGENMSFMGREYHCELKKGVGADTQPLCAMQATPPENTVFLFTQKDYANDDIWYGHSMVATLGEEVPDAVVRSFKLGKGVQLIGYPSPNFNGEAQIYTESKMNVVKTIRSYKIKVEKTTQALTFDYISKTANKTCITLFAPSNTAAVTSCSDDKPPQTKVFAHYPIKPMTEQVAVYISEFKEGTSHNVVTGQFFLIFTETSVQLLTHGQLPPEVNTVLSGDNVTITYTK